MIFFFFFFNDTATTEIYTLSLHDALPTLPLAWQRVLELPDDVLKRRLRFRRSAQALAHSSRIPREARVTLGDVVLHPQPTLQRLHRAFGALRQVEGLVEVAHLQRTRQVGSAPLRHVQGVLEPEVLGDAWIDLRDGLAGHLGLLFQLLRQLLAAFLLEALLRLGLHLPAQLASPLLQVLLLRLELLQLICGLAQRLRLLRVLA